MWIIAGLGNYEARYDGTRHNIGFEVAEALAERAGTSISEKKFKARMAKARLAGSDCVILKPQTFMNLSGESVGPALGFFKLTTEQLIVVHDELDLELGKVRLKRGGGHGGHNGLRSLIQHLPDPNFIRIRIGVGRPPSGWDPADYVLSRYLSSERDAVDKQIAAAVDAVEAIMKDGLARAMNVFNREPKSEKPKKEPRKEGSAEGSKKPDADEKEAEAIEPKGSGEKERGHGQRA